MVFNREVGEFECKFTDDTGLAPTHREFDLVVGFRFETENNVDRAVFFVRLGTDIHVFGVEVSGLGDFASRAHKVGFREELAGFHAELAAYNLFVKTVVTVDNHVVDSRLGAFNDAHFQCDGVAGDFAFDGHEVIEKITLVHVEVGYCIVVFGKAFVHQLLVVDVAGAHVEVGVEHVGGINGISDPVDVLDVVFVAFVD